MKVSILGTDSAYEINTDTELPAPGDVQFVVTGLVFVDVAEDGSSATAALIGLSSMGMKTSGLFPEVPEDLEKV